MPAPQKIHDLIARFERNRKHYRAAPPRKTILQRQLTATDNQIDQLVYQLYGLTAEETAVVEGKTQLK